MSRGSNLQDAAEAPAGCVFGSSGVVLTLCGRDAAVTTPSGLRLKKSWLVLFVSHDNKCLNRRLTLFMSPDVSLCVQILQGDARGHSGLRRHECRVLRQRQTMVT